MSEVEALKQMARTEIDQMADALIAASDQMARESEIGHQEFKSVALLRGLLAQRGVSSEAVVAGMATAFRAELRGQRTRPRIVILAEYDALPEVGHGCGHNIIGTAAAGAFLALERVIGQLPGSVALFGTPCEESTAPNAGGKVLFAEAGMFDDVDAAIMVHPGTRTLLSMRSSLAARGFDFHFTGRAAHAAAKPHEGINALDAVILTFNGINALRQHVKPDVRIHGIITHGGAAANVVPAEASCRFRVRAMSTEYLEEVVQKVIRCAEGAALMTGATLQWREYANPYANLIPNKALNDVAAANLQQLGVTLDPEPAEGGLGSTDLGNVSHKTPATSISISITRDESVRGHSREFAAATVSDAGHAGLILAAKVLAMTAIDLIARPDVLAAIRAEWQQALQPKG